jgi:hypothetical protein
MVRFLILLVPGAFGVGGVIQLPFGSQLGISLPVLSLYPPSSIANIHQMTLHTPALTPEPLAPTHQVAA